MGYDAFMQQTALQYNRISIPAVILCRSRGNCFGEGTEFQFNNNRIHSDI